LAHLPDGYLRFRYHDPTQKWIRAAGDQAINGWAKSARVEAEASAWFDATNLGEGKAIVGRLNRAATEHVVYAPLGIYLVKYTFQKGLTGVASGPVPIF
jgi:peptide/nickel transport system substrate-binding protein